MLADKSAAGGVVKNEIISNKESLKELHKRIIRKLKEKKNAFIFYEQYLGADLADIQLIKKFNKIFGFLLCIIDISYKFSWVIWVGKGSKIYNGSIKLSLEQNAVKMY